MRGNKRRKKKKTKKTLPPNVSKSNNSVSSQGRPWGMGCAGLGWATLRPSVLRGVLGLWGFAGDVGARWGFTPGLQLRGCPEHLGFPLGLLGTEVSVQQRGRPGAEL